MAVREGKTLKDQFALVVPYVAGMVFTNWSECFWRSHGSLMMSSQNFMLEAVSPIP